MMKYRSYWEWKADERLAQEEAHFDAFHTSIQDILGAFIGASITFFCCVLALIIPSKRIRVKE